MSFVWKQVLSRLEQRIPKDQIDEWLRPTKILSETENSLVIGVPQDFFIDWIQENYLEEIYLILKNLGLNNRTIQFQNIERIQKQGQIPLNAKNNSRVVHQKEILKLNKKYVFDTFVVGPSNQFAHAAALAVAESPSTTYNPLFLYGSSGLGKTHLLHAIGHKLNEKTSPHKICYTTCEEFTNQFINSIRFNKGEVFREHYRSVDILLIDDIQFLSGKTQTQEEFFHTFNALFEQQKQIILTSDCSPSEIPKLENRLTSRFQWGLIADIQPPALETRIVILKKKAEQEQIYLRDDVVLYIASKVKTNVRELEGALIKLMAYASLSNRKIDLELAEESLRNFVKEEGAHISCEKIQRFIADQFNLHPKELITKNNSKRVAQPRQVAMYLTRQLTPMSLPEIGVAFGNKHHSTVLYSIQKIEKQMKTNSEYQLMITSFKKSLI